MEIPLPTNQVQYIKRGRKGAGRRAVAVIPTGGVSALQQGYRRVGDGTGPPLARCQEELKPATQPKPYIEPGETVATGGRASATSSARGLAKTLLLFWLEEETVLALVDEVAGREVRGTEVLTPADNQPRFGRVPSHVTHPPVATGGLS